MFDLAKLKAASDSWPVPAHDLPHVQERARVLVRRRRVLTYGFSTLFILAVVAVGLTWSQTLRDDNFQVRPAGETQEGARAATFAFHALLDTTNYNDPEIGPYDYQSVEQTGSSEWKVHFEVGADPQQIRQILRSRRLMLNSTRVRATDEFRNEIRDLKARLKNALAAGGPFDFEVTVEKSGQELRVAEIDGPASEQLKASLLAFTETVNEIPAQGMEHWNIRIKNFGRGDVSLEANTFWTGTIPSAYRETCHLSLVNGDGKTLFTQQDSGDLAPQPDTAPESEDFRDWGFGGSGGRIPDRLLDRDDLHGEINCHPVDGEGWVAVGEAEVKPVTEEFSMGSAERLDPERHVLVSSHIVYKGDPGIESICIARVFDEQGDEISSHGWTIPQMDELELLYGKNPKAEIPVDVGDPDLADYATVDCQPTVPGVNLGPDQED